MNTQPIDPRALKLAEEINRIAVESEDLLSGDRLARIIQSHFAESVNHALLKALSELVTDPIIRHWLAQTGTISDYENLIIKAKGQS